MTRRTSHYPFRPLPKPEEPEESGSPQTSLNGEGSIALEESNNPQTSLKEEDSIALEELHKTQSDLDA